jgi:putative intracellular protease/amidase
MRQYLSSAQLHATVAQFWALDRPVAAICHGVLVLARATDPRPGRSVLAPCQTTRPRYMERGAYLATAAAWPLLPDLPGACQEEVTAAVRSPAQLHTGPRTTARGTATDDRHAFVVQDGRYLSARWPGDAYLFARRFHQMLTSPG